MQWLADPSSCQQFIWQQRLAPTLRGWPEKAMMQYEGPVENRPDLRYHVRHYGTHCKCEVEPSPESDPAYHIGTDLVVGGGVTAIGALIGASLNENDPAKGAMVGGGLGAAAYVFFKLLG